MRVAYFTTWPPETTGIAEWSKSLFSGCKNLDIFTFSPSTIADPNVKLWFNAVLAKYTHLIFAVGNSDHNVPVLRFLYRVSAIAPKNITLILHIHDPVLFNLVDKVKGKDYCSDWYLSHRFTKSRIGPVGLLDKNLGGISPLIDGVNIAKIIVHSSTAHNLIKNELDTINNNIEIKTFFMPCFEKFSNKKERSFDLGTYGVQDSAKISHETIKSFHKCYEKGLINSAVVAGYNAKSFFDDNPDLKRDFITIVENPNHEDLLDLIANTKVAVQLRRRSTGESSAVTPLLICHSVPSIVSNIGSFSELPNQIFKKIDNNSNIIDTLSTEIESLLSTEPNVEVYKNIYDQFSPQNFLVQLSTWIGINVSWGSSPSITASRNPISLDSIETNEPVSCSTDIKSSFSNIELVLHLGSFKTGTSSLQATMAKNRTLLLDHGILYPRFMSDAAYGSVHHELFNFINRDSNKIESKEFTHFFESLHAEINHKTKQIVFSSETLCRLDNLSVLSWMAKFFKSVNLILYVREPISLTLSTLIQGIQQYSNVIHPEKFTPDYYVLPSRWINFFQGFEKSMQKQGVNVNFTFKEFSRSMLEKSDIVCDFFQVLGKSHLVSLMQRNDYEDNPSIAGSLLLSKIIFNTVNQGKPIKEFSHYHDIFQVVSSFAPNKFMGATKVSDDFASYLVKQFETETIMLKEFGLSLPSFSNKGTPLLNSELTDDYHFIRKHVNELAQEKGLSLIFPI